MSSISLFPTLLNLNDELSRKRSFYFDVIFGFLMNFSAGTKSIYEEIVLQATDKSYFSCFKNFLLTFKTAILSNFGGKGSLRKFYKSWACPLFKLII